MKVAIHHNKNSFSEGWIEYCENLNIDYKLVNSYDDDIIEQVKDCDVFMWHFQHINYKDVLFAKQLLFSLEMMGIKVFPNINTCLYFDDKLAQKYILEGINAPLIPTNVFFGKKEALAWAKNATFPKVFKLRSGASGMNVYLLKSRRKARHFIKKAFGRGFSKKNNFNVLKDFFNGYLNGKNSFRDVLVRLYHVIMPNDFSKFLGREKGYVYFQDFIPNIKYDIRVVVIGERAFAIKRLVHGSFKASGSEVCGEVQYGEEHFDENLIGIAFSISDKLKTQCLGIDFLFNDLMEPFIAEMGFGFINDAYKDKCVGYWDKNLVFHKEMFDPSKWMIENTLKNE